MAQPPNFLPSQSHPPIVMAKTGFPFVDSDARVYHVKEAPNTICIGSCLLGLAYRRGRQHHLSNTGSSSLLDYSSVTNVEQSPFENIKTRMQSYASFYHSLDLRLTDEITQPTLQKRCRMPQVTLTAQKVFVDSGLVSLFLKHALPMLIAYARDCCTCLHNDNHSRHPIQCLPKSQVCLGRSSTEIHRHLPTQRSQHTRCIPQTLDNPLLRRLRRPLRSCHITIHR